MNKIMHDFHLVAHTTDEILDDDNLKRAIRKVRENKGKPGPNGRTVFEVAEFFDEHKEEIQNAIKTRTYKPSPVRRVNIPKPNGKTRPLGIPNVEDRVIQQAAAQVLQQIYEPLFHPNSMGYRPGLGAHDGIRKALEYLNEGYEWVVDLDIEKFFDTVNHDKLISLVRKEVLDGDAVSLIRKFLKAGVMIDGVVMPADRGTVQGGNISPVLSLIYLNELDWELDKRGHKFVRYADDIVIFTKSEKAANRVMNSICSWIEAKLFLKVSAAKTKAVRSEDSSFLGFTFVKWNGKWNCKPCADRLDRLKNEIRKITCRRKAAAIPLEKTFEDIYDKVKGWIDCCCIGMMKGLMRKFGGWLRHRVRMVILKQWKRRPAIFKNLKRIWLMIDRFADWYSRKRGKRVKIARMNEKFICNHAYARCGWYRLSSNMVVNNLLHPTLLETRVIFKFAGIIRKRKEGDKQRPTRRKIPVALINPLNYYLSHMTA